METCGRFSSKAALFLLSGSLLFSAACAGRRTSPTAASAEPAAEDRTARIESAYAAIRAQRWKEAVNLLDALIDEDPSALRLRMERGYARQHLGQLDAAADDFSYSAREPGEFQPQARAALKELALESTETARAGRRDAALNVGYDDLRRGDKTAARAEFKEALAEDPAKTEITKQLAYMSIDDGDLLDAVKEFEGAHRLSPLDHQTELELGYVYDSLHDEAGAQASFLAASASDDPNIHDKAAGALKNIRDKTAPLYIDVYASPNYSSRFSDAIAYFEASAGYRPNPAGPLSVYFGSRYTQDSRSHSGQTPEIYSDNYGSFEPGVRFQPQGFNANLTAEWGMAVNLLRSAEHPAATEFDGRVVLADYHYWEGMRRLFADAGGSAGFYSRYRDDGIGYLQLRGGVKAWDDHAAQLSVYVPVNVYRDVNRDFYNNAVEIGAGVELQPWTKIDMKLRAEYLHGTYMGIVGRDPNPYGPHYTDFRITLIYAGHFTPRNAPADPPTIHRPAFAW